MQQLNPVQSNKKEEARAQKTALRYYQQKVNNYDVGVATPAVRAFDSLSIDSQCAIYIIRRQQAKKICIKLLSINLSFKLVKS